jgi:hypothetical protein
MPVIINGTTGVTFPNGVTMSDGTSAPVTVAQGGTGANTASAARTSLGVAIGTDVLAPNGSGANLTSLNASSISAGTLAVARGGTGTSSPSLVGGTNITISGTWPNQTVTAAGGGVTSLNGQTGAITNTDYGAIGSYIVAYGAVSTGYSAGSTIAGSSLVRAAYDLPPAATVGGLNVYLTTTSGGGVSTPAFVVGNDFIKTSLGLSGTWRAMTNGGGSLTNSNQQHLWVRIS